MEALDLEAAHPGSHSGRRRSPHRGGERPGGASRSQAPHETHGAAQPAKPSATAAPPMLARGHIARPHLVARLQGQRAVASTIVLTAPAGYGKSGLLCEWAAGEDRPFAWIELSRADDEPDRLAARIAGALGLLHGRRKGSARVTAPAADGAQAGADLSRAFELLARRGEDAVLVLDDVHELRSSQTREMLAELAHGLPEQLTLALSSRNETSLRLGRLRAAHRLLHLGPADLAMTAYEGHRILEQAGIEHDEQTLERLVDRTEGWPAGIYLAGLSLSARTDAGERDAQPAGDDHLVAEYLREEVIAPLDAESRALLTRTALLDELSGELCDAVLDCGGTGLMLRRIAAETLLLIPQDAGRSWYRCHTLLRDVLRSELELGEPSEIPRLHRRASEWFASRGMLELAVEHAVAARDAERTGRLLWDAGSRFLYGGGQHPQGWLAAFTEEDLAGSAELSLASAHASFALGELPRARRCACLAADALDPAVNGAQRSSLRAGALLIEAAAGSGGIEQVASSAQAAEGLLGDASFLRPVSSLLRGIAAHLLGERERAAELLGEALDACARTMPWVESLSLTQLALIDIEDGDWEQAADRTTQALGRLQDEGLDSRPTAALTFAVSALVMAHRGLADEAKQELTAAARLLDALGEYMPWYEVETRIAMARASTRLADVARARTLLSQASRWARRPRPVPCFVSWLDAAWGEIDDVSAAALNGPGSLTMAELRVLRFLPTHLSFREIGERLHVSGNTVKSQAHAVYAKLAAGSRTEAVAHAAALGLIDPPVV
jgi:LuxR family transcriptional regulator, maltose regulon positive regulatory protein